MCCGGKKQHVLDLEEDWRRRPWIWFHSWSPHFVSLIHQPPPLLSHWRNSWALVKPRTLMGAVGGRGQEGSLLLDAHPLPTTSLHHYHPTDYPMASSSSTGTELCRTQRPSALCPSRHWKQQKRPPRPTPPFVFLLLPLSVCVLTVAAVKNNWTFLTAAPRP